MKSPLWFTSLISGLLVFPFFTHAQTAQEFVVNLTNFLGTVFVPFLFGIAFLVFVFNAFRFFIIGGSNEDGREKAKSLAIYSVAAFVFLLIFWGIINMLSTSLGLEGQINPGSDYRERDRWSTLGNGECEIGEAPPDC